MQIIYQNAKICDNKINKKIVFIVGGIQGGGGNQSSGNNFLSWMNQGVGSGGGGQGSQDGNQWSRPNNQEKGLF